MITSPFAACLDLPSRRTTVGSFGCTEALWQTVTTDV